jgi:hypothetical protein
VQAADLLSITGARVIDAASPIPDKHI